MPIQTSCTGCGKTLSVADEHAGKRAKCPACGTIYTVPYPTAPIQAELGPSAQSDFQNSQNSDVANASQPMGGDSYDHSFQSEDVFWMRSKDGSVYGPTDRENLNRWFREGRVGAGYQIRLGETGLWEDAGLFRPDTTQSPGAVGSQSSNPYAQSSASWPASEGSAPLYKYPKQDRGVIVLIMGILSFAICFIFGIVAVVMGRGALSDINAGLANPSDKPLVQIGFWLGVANLILHFFGLLILLVGIALSVVSQ